MVSMTIRCGSWIADHRILLASLADVNAHMHMAPKRNKVPMSIGERIEKLELQRVKRSIH